MRLTTAAGHQKRYKMTTTKQKRGAKRKIIEGLICYYSTNSIMSELMDFLICKEVHNVMDCMNCKDYPCKTFHYEHYENAKTDV